MRKGNFRSTALVSDLIRIVGAEEEGEQSFNLKDVNLATFGNAVENAPEFLFHDETRRIPENRKGLRVVLKHDSLCVAKFNQFITHTLKGFKHLALLFRGRHKKNIRRV